MGLLLGLGLGLGYVPEGICCVYRVFVQEFVHVSLSGTCMSMSPLSMHVAFSVYVCVGNARGVEVIVFAQYCYCNFCRAVGVMYFLSFIVSTAVFCSACFCLVAWC